jgi:hypothetical protein
MEIKMAEDPNVAIVNQTADEIFDNYIEANVSEEGDFADEMVGVATGTRESKFEDNLEEAFADEARPASDSDEVEGEDEEVEAKDAEEGEDEKAEEVEDKDLSPKANKRFQQLANERKELRSIVEQQTQQMQQMQQYIAHLAQQQQQAQVTKQEELARLQLEHFERQKRNEERRLERERLEAMDPADRWRLETEQEAIRKAEQKFAEHLRPIKEKLEYYERSAQEARQRAARENDIRVFSQRSATAAKSFLDVLPEDKRDSFQAEFSDAILTYAAAYAIPPEEAAKKLQSTFDAYADAKFKSKVAKTKSATTPRQKGAPLLPKSNARAANSGGGKWPALSQLQQHGYSDYLDWLDAGQPSL